MARTVPSYQERSRLQWSRLAQARTLRPVVRTHKMYSREESRIFVIGADAEINFSGSSFYFSRSLAEIIGKDRVIPIPIHTYRRLYVPTLLWGIKMMVDPRGYFFMSREFQEANYAVGGATPRSG